jgi:hypothetical protein
MSKKDEWLRQKYADLLIATSLLDEYHEHTPPKRDRETILRDLAEEKAAARRCFQGQPFSRVFTQPRTARPNEWRIKYSGIQGVPEESDTIHAVWAACLHLGIEVKEQNWGSAANADSYELKSTFLDGGFRSKTGNYWCAPRGAWVTGAKAVLLIALTLELRIRPAWYRGHGLKGVSLAQLRSAV